ncbi:four and a half LIM domains protein 3 isoform X1 [Piliocolobus tephrosceles]|uniref:four and a half LIM domains protein 3 isoform X1 n=1 Tax=Piliocolobus tephrosceles TaxID=591936 RepID=UPI000E6B270D|nr:four and a half LIM domains protein 3 isoform X1 [Piliocolobus tephrosceles]XP_023052246.2 four and a half LIM domains protein 3 isoform X1 [Piliocolobus tephrosceles]
MSESFDCAKCSESLYGRKYIQTDSGPYCVPCYDNTFANTCAECQQLIGHDSRELFYEDRHFHEGCFRCCRCQRSLADEPFTCQDSELLCNDCYCSAFSSQCSACGETVMPGSRKLEYGGQTWHEHCFLCSGCEQPLGSRSFVPDKGAHYCVPCYENKFAPRCARCSKTLTQGGVTYRDQPWHRECLVCTGCQTPLAGQQFTSRDEDPYCVACFGELFAPKCSSCKRPIDSVEASMCPLKTDTGTTTASPAPAALPPWWAKALCRMETKCSARAVARQGPEPGSWTQAFPYHRPRTVAPFLNHLWDSAPPPATKKHASPSGLQDCFPTPASPNWYSLTQAPKPGLL